MSKRKKVNEWKIVDISQLPPIKDLQVAELKKFTKGELRSYLLYYGVEPQDRKPDLKAQIRKLIEAAKEGKLKKQNPKKVVTTEEPPLVICSNCGNFIEEECPYKRCKSCCFVAGLVCRIHSGNTSLSNKKPRIDKSPSLTDNYEAVFSNALYRFRSNSYNFNQIFLGPSVEEIINDLGQTTQKKDIIRLLESQKEELLKDVQLMKANHQQYIKTQKEKSLHL